MKIKISAWNIQESKDEKFEVDEPGICPICNTSFGGQFVSAYSLPQNDNLTIYSTYLCKACSNCFFALYQGYHLGTKRLVNLLPHGQQSKDFSKFIKALSPNFVKIYNQSLNAENYGLDEVCGLGYRKALEFLVKDYLIFLNQENSESIAMASLGSLIKNQIQNKNIKILAERCAWLGNDEAHYIRKHENYDVQDLKRFLNAMITYIDSELTVLEALDIERK